MRVIIWCGRYACFATAKKKKKKKRKERKKEKRACKECVPYYFDMVDTNASNGLCHILVRHTYMPVTKYVSYSWKHWSHWPSFFKSTWTCLLAIVLLEIDPRSTRTPRITSRMRVSHDRLTGQICIAASLCHKQTADRRTSLNFYNPWTNTCWAAKKWPCWLVFTRQQPMRSS